MTARRHRYADPAVLAVIGRLELRARKAVEGFISGQHRSPYHGFSVEFAAHREYSPGDDLRHIDWKVYARADRYYVKQYEEETNLRCTLFLDCSRSMAYGEDLPGPVPGKFTYAATAAAALAYLIHRQQDAVGLLAFDAAVREQVPAATSSGHFRELMAALERIRPGQTGFLGREFARLSYELPGRGLAVIVSDCLCEADELRAAIRALRSRGNEVLLIQVLHQDEVVFPFDQTTQFRGLEEPAELLVDPRALRRSYLRELEAFQAEVRRMCAAEQVDLVAAHTGERLDGVLGAYLMLRQRSRATHRGLGAAARPGGG